MSLMIELDDALQAALEMQAEVTGETPAELAQRLLREQLFGADSTASAAFQRNLAAFHRMLPGLLKQYPGKAVAFLDGELVGVGEDRVALAKEMWATYGRVELLVREVTRTPRVLHINHHQTI